MENIIELVTYVHASEDYIADLVRHDEVDDYEIDRVFDAISYAMEEFEDAMVELT
jgi:hypothetical protein